MSPVIIHPFRPWLLYRFALIFIVIGLSPPILIWLLGSDGDAGRISPGLAIVGGIICIGYGLAVAANTFLRYPLLRIEPDRVTLARTPLTQKTIENLGELGPAYVVQHKLNGFPHTDLVFRLAADEAAHQAKIGHPSPPEHDQVVERLPLDRLTGNDLQVAQAIAAEINSQRGLAAT